MTITPCIRFSNGYNLKKLSLGYTFVLACAGDELLFTRSLFAKLLFAKSLFAKLLFAKSLLEKLNRYALAPSVLVALAFVIVFTLGCGSSHNASTGNDTSPDAWSHSGDYPIETVATVGMVADLVRHVGGEHVTVDQICGSGVDPHLFKATRDDMQTIMAGQLVFYCGLMLEGKLVNTLSNIAKDKPVVAITDAIDDRMLIKPAGFNSHPDPHVWNDVSAWAQCIDAVQTALTKYDPSHADDYQTNAAQYRQRLMRLHQYGVESIATIPTESRLLVTSHDAFHYFGRAYSIEVQGVQGLSTESEAGVQRINELVDTLVDRRVKAVFVESSVSRKNIDALIEGAKSRGHDVVVGGELFSDAMGKIGTYEGTYVGMLDHNITLVTNKLGGKVGSGGFAGFDKAITASEEKNATTIAAEIGGQP